MERLPVATRLARQKRVQIRDILKEYDPSRSGRVTVEQFRQALMTEQVHLSREDFGHLVQLYGEGKFIRFMPALKLLKLVHKEGDWFVPRDAGSPVKPVQKSLMSVLACCNKAHLEPKHLQHLIAKCESAQALSGQLTVKVFQRLLGPRLNNEVRTALTSFLKDEKGLITLSRLQRLLEEFKRERAAKNSMVDRFLFRDEYRQYSKTDFVTLKALFSEELQRRHRTIREAYIHCDLDGDGKLTFSDFWTGASHLSVAVNQQELHKFFAHLDKGHKGFLSFVDFSKIFDATHHSESPAKISEYDPYHAHKLLCRNQTPVPNITSNNSSFNRKLSWRRAHR